MVEIRLKNLDVIKEGSNNTIIFDENAELTEIVFYKTSITKKIYNELKKWQDANNFVNEGIYFNYKGHSISKFFFETREKMYEEGERMDFKENMGSVLTTNKEALKNAARIELGNAAIIQASKVVMSKAPKQLKKYAGNPFVEIAIANAFAIGISQVDNEKADYIANAMIEAASLKLVQNFNFPDMVDEFVSNFDLDKMVKG